MHTFYHRLWCLAACAAPAIASAQTADTTIAPQQLAPVEVRGLRAGANSPFVTTELSSRDIRKLNLGQDIPFLLQYTPSVVVTSDAGTGIGYTALRVRGTDGTRMNVTLNGIPVNDAESQGVFFVNLPDLASSTGSIQLQRGVGTSTNGPAAFGATMSISNSTPMATPGAEVNITAGSFSTQKYTARAYTGLLPSGLSFDVRLSKISSLGFIDRGGSDLKSLQFLVGWKASERTSFRFLVLTGREKTYQAWNGVPEAKLRGDDSALLTHYNNNIGVLYFNSADSQNLFTADPRRFNTFRYDNQTDNYQQDYYQFFADHRFGNYLTGNVGLFLTRGRGYYEEFKFAQSYADYGLADVVSPSGTDTLTSTDLIRQLWLDNYYYGGVFSLLYEKGATQAVLGGGLTRYDGEHYGFVKWAQNGGVPSDYRWYLLDANKTDANVYLKAQQSIGQSLYLFGDVQYRHVQYNINGFRNNPALTPAVTYNFFNPKLGLTYLLRNNSQQRQKLYISAAVANKEPNRDDFEASPISLPLHETLYDGELGYEISKRSWSVNANLYYMYYHNQLVLTGKVNDVGAYTRTNVPESYRAGLELQGSVLPVWWLRISANATVSQNKIISFTEFVDDYDNGGQLAIDRGTTDIAFSPNIISAGGITLMPLRNAPKGQTLELDIMGKYVGRQCLDNTSNTARQIEAYGLCDIRLRYSIATKPFKDLGFNIAVNNLLNTAYVSNGYTYSYYYNDATTTENFYYPQAGVNFLAGISMRW